tara:strand:- start:18 stop:533 length:516 start_codon:yes stop_codon:yes gene_type:complete
LKKFIIASLLLLSPVSLYPANTPDMEKLGKAMKLDCKYYGEDSCFARIISVAGCTFSYGIAYSKKSVSESLTIADDLFVLMAKGNNLNPRNLFDENNLIKQPIREETFERIAMCKEWTKEAIPKIVLEKTGKPATPEFIEGATKSFALWWMSTYETIIKQEKTTSSRSSRI